MSGTKDSDVSHRRLNCVQHWLTLWAGLWHVPLLLLQILIGLKIIWMSLGNTAVMRKAGSSHILHLLFHVFDSHKSLIWNLFLVTPLNGSICMYACASKTLMSAFKTEKGLCEIDWCLCCLFLSDIPRIPDTSHPPLESSRYLIYLYICLYGGFLIWWIMDKRPFHIQFA